MMPTVPDPEPIKTWVSPLASVTRTYQPLGTVELAKTYTLVRASRSSNCSPVAAGVLRPEKNGAAQAVSVVSIACVSLAAPKRALT